MLCDRKATKDSIFCELHNGGPGDYAFSAWILNLTSSVGVSVASQIIVGILKHALGLPGLSMHQVAVIATFQNGNTAVVGEIEKLFDDVDKDSLKKAISRSLANSAHYRSEIVRASGDEVTARSRQTSELTKS